MDFQENNHAAINVDLMKVELNLRFKLRADKEL